MPCITPREFRTYITYFCVFTSIAIPHRSQKLASTKRTAVKSFLVLIQMNGNVADSIQHFFENRAFVWALNQKTFHYVYFFWNYYLSFHNCEVFQASLTTEAFRLFFSVIFCNAFVQFTFHFQHYFHFQEFFFSLTK